jgi:phage tail sheath gpL-like
MPSTGYPLTGISATSPLPGIRREMLFAQGNSGTGGKRRDVVLVGNKTAGASRILDGNGNATETIQGPITSKADLETQFGRKSEIYWGYTRFVEVDPNPTIYVVVVAENASAAAATRTYTFVTAASEAGTLIIEWGGESVEVSVASGDTAITQAAAAVSAITKQTYWPFSAAVGGGGSEHIVTIAASNGGPRGDLVVGRVRMRYRKSISTVITASAVSSGTGADDYTDALAALNASEFHYHVAACTATSGVTSTDNGVGEYISSIVTAALPANGKDQEVHFGLVSTQANATTVATSSAANSVHAFFHRAENNDWTPFMIAAHNCAAKRSKEIAHPSANLTGYTNSDSSVYKVPDPYDKNDRPTLAELEADLDNGVTPIAFAPNGAAYIPRMVSSRSWLGTSATKDYRAREGHIGSAIKYTWAEVKSRYVATRQDHVAADPVKGQKPLAGVTYPSAVKSLLLGVIDDLAGPAVGGIPVLDPSPEAIARMKASVNVVDMADGISATVDFEPVRHNNKGNFLVKQTGPAY